MKKNIYKVLAVYTLKYKAGRDHFTGILDEISNKLNWQLHATRPEKFFSKHELFDEEGKLFDGIILSMAGSDDIMEEIAKSDIPVVLVNITDKKLSARNKSISTVWLDNDDIGKRASQYFLSQGGFKSAGFVHELEIPFYSIERMNAFRSGMKKGGIETSVFPAKDNTNDGFSYFSHLRTWLRSLPKPAAIMACNDRRAADVINMCKNEGISIPNQIAIIGVDNDILQHEQCGMSISSVVIDFRTIGSAAIRELEFLFRHPNFHGRRREVLIPSKSIYIGESTMRSTTIVRTAEAIINLINENSTSCISPNEIADRLGYSRRFADKCLSEIYGKPIHKAIEEIRLNEARRRILDGESVRNIVKSMQFTSENQFYRILFFNRTFYL